MPSSFFNASVVSVRKIPSRGHFYCSPLSAHRCRGQKCMFKVSYLLDRKKKEYRFTSNIVLSHSHTLHSHLVVLDGKVVVNLENDLTTAEGYLIKQLSCARINVPQMSTVLERMFTGRAFSRGLLFRLQKILWIKLSAKTGIIFLACLRNVNQFEEMVDCLLWSHLLKILASNPSIASLN